MTLILCFFTVLGCAVDTPSTTTGATTSIGPTTTIDIAAKMSSELAQELAESNETDLIQYYVFLGDLDPDELARSLLPYGIIEAVYRDETRFLEHMANLYGNDTEQIAAERERYARLRLQVIAAITESRIEAFCTDNGIDESRIIYRGTYTMTLILETDAATLRQIAADARITSLDLYREDIQIINE